VQYVVVRKHGDVQIVFDWAGPEQALVSFGTEKPCCMRKVVMQFRSASQVRNYPCSGRGVITGVSDFEGLTRLGAK
jgi:hypothetical protein